MANLRHLIGVIRSFGLPVVVALNRFPADTAEELRIAKQGSEEAGASAAVESTAFAEGGAGATDLAQALIDATAAAPPGAAPEPNYAYALSDSLEDKVLALARRVYNADDVSWSAAARAQLRRFTALGWDNLPVCMAKTHLSISDRPERKGCPSGYTFEVSDVRASVGAGFIYPIAGNIVTMPGLPSNPPLPRHRPRRRHHRPVRCGLPALRRRGLLGVVIERVSHRRDLLFHRERLQPFSRDSLNAVVGARNLPIDCGSGVGVIT